MLITRKVVSFVISCKNITASLFQKDAFDALLYVQFYEKLQAFFVIVIQSFRHALTNKIKDAFVLQTFCVNIIKG